MPRTRPTSDRCSEVSLRPALPAMRLLAAAFALFAAPAAWAQDFPELTGRVVDAADVIPPAEETALAGKLEALETQSQRQFVVATIPDLEGYDIADYGYRLGRHWRIGDEERNDGVLLIVAPNERKVRIEVGYGLEPVLTDGLSFLIISNDIVPRFKDGDMPGGIAAGADAVIAQLALPEDEAMAIAQQANERPVSEAAGLGFADMIFLLVFFFFFVLPIIRAMRGGRRYGGAPVIVWGGSSSGSSWGGSSGGFSGGGFSGGGGSFGGGGASGSW